MTSHRGICSAYVHNSTGPIKDIVETLSAEDSVDHLRILVSELEIEVLADFLQDLTADLLEMNFSSLSFSKASYKAFGVVKDGRKVCGGGDDSQIACTTDTPSEVSICLTVLDTLAAFFSTMNSTSSELMSLTYFSFSCKQLRGIARSFCHLSDLNYTKLAGESAAKHVIELLDL